MDFLCQQMATQAIFVNTLMRSLVHSGGASQCWIPVAYPSWFGFHHHQCRLVAGDIQDLTEEEGVDGKNEQRVSLSLTLEGYCPDTNIELHPTLWFMVGSQNTVSSAELHQVFDPPQRTFTEDLRENPANSVFNEKGDLPQT
jgi:hypothetical protein